MPVYYDLFLRERKAILTHAIVDPRVLVWSINYETAVFKLDDKIHPKTEWVWFQMNMFHIPDIRKNLILKMRYFTKAQDPLESLLITHKPYYAELLEECWGNVPFKNEVVFTKHPKYMHTASAAGNTAEAVFPQNQKNQRIEYLRGNMIPMGASESVRKSMRHLHPFTGVENS